MDTPNNKAGELTVAFMQKYFWSQGIEPICVSLTTSQYNKLYGVMYKIFAQHDKTLEDCLSIVRNHNGCGSHCMKSDMFITCQEIIKGELEDLQLATEEK